MEADSLGGVVGRLLLGVVLAAILLGGQHVYHTRFGTMEARYTRSAQHDTCNGSDGGQADGDGADDCCEEEANGMANGMANGGAVGGRAARHHADRHRRGWVESLAPTRTLLTLALALAQA